MSAVRFISRGIGCSYFSRNFLVIRFNGMTSSKITGTGYIFKSSIVCKRSAEAIFEFLNEAEN